MGEQMIDWDQTQLIKWIHSIPTSKLSQTVTNQIITGVNDYSQENDMEITGKDFIEANQNDLKDMCKIDGPKANKLLQIIRDQLDTEFEDKSNKLGNGGSRHNNDTSNNLFTLNFVGPQGKPITLRNIQKTMFVSKVKAKYLNEYGDETSAHKYANKKWGTDTKGQITFKYKSKPMLDNKILSYYDCNDGLLPIIVVFRVQGGTYEVGDMISLKLELDTETTWVTAKVKEVLSTRVFVMYESYGEVKTEWIYTADMKQRVKPLNNSAKLRTTAINGDEIKPITEFQGTHDANVHETIKKQNNANVQLMSNIESTQTETTQGNVEQISNVKVCMKKMGLKTNDKVQVLIDATNQWVNGKISNIFDKRVQIKYCKDTETQSVCINIYDHEIEKRIRLWKDYKHKPMIEWDNDDVLCWVKSTPAFKKYAKKFSKSINGKELLDTTRDDLALIISSSLQRRKFMEKLEIAKNQYTNTGGMDDQKSTSIDVNGLVSLNNLGNTCYMNTSIQLLSQTPHITRYLKKRANSRDFITVMNSSKLENSGKTKRINYRSMLNAWTDLCDIIYNQPRDTYSPQMITVYTPSQIKDALHRIDQDFGSGEQDDSVRSLIMMLQALDSEIEDEINQNKAHKNGNVEYMDTCQLNHGNQLSNKDENKVIQTLLSRHNPNNSIVRKTFDGVERLIYECLHCNKILQQYVICRDLDLPVISHDVMFENVCIVFNNSFFTLPKCMLLDYCGIDVLKYEAMQYLKTLDDYKEDKIDIGELDVVTLSNNGELKYFDKENKISELEKSNGNVFVLINIIGKNPSHSNSKLLQFKIFIDENGETSTSQHAQCQYIKCEQNKVCYYIMEEIGTPLTNNYNYIIHYNGSILSPKRQMNPTDFQSIHNHETNINVLFLLCVHSDNIELNLNINNIDSKVLNDAADFYQYVWMLSRNLGAVTFGYDLLLDAVEKFGQWKQSKHNGKNINSSNSHFHELPQLQDQLQNDIEVQLNNIGKTINELKKKKCINAFVRRWLNGNFNTKTSKTKELTDIIECLREYQKTKIVDKTVFEYKCVHCYEQCRWTKISKEIMSTPPVLILHLDRFGKISSRKKSERRKKNRRSNDHDYYASFTSNKFDHEITYEDKLLWNNDNNKEYCLFGISNHTGGTKGGHYTATIKCLSDQKWYRISDRSCSLSFNRLDNRKEATILMYSSQK